MTYGAFTQDYAPFECVVRSRTPLPQVAICALALVAATSVGLWALYARQGMPVAQVAASGPATTIRTVAAQAVASRVAAITSLRTAALHAIPTSVKSPAETVRGLLDPSLTTSYGAVVFARSVPLRSSGDARPISAPVVVSQGQTALPAAPIVSPIQIAAVAPVATVLPHVAPAEAVAPAEVVAPMEPVASLPAEEVDVPLPLPRPASLARSVPSAPVDRRAPSQMADVGAAAAAATAEDKPSFFDKLFSRPKETGPVLAYAAPEDGLIGNVFKDTIGRPAAAPDRYTAVYNITTHTVTLPDGTRLEAHSGLGAAKDNPRMVSLRMVGATPPNVYELTPREAIFHGVRALRLTPTGGTTFGRAGLLTHSYMLRGRSGESNGCVVFADYAAFLRAYDAGAIRRLAVVAGG